MLNGPVRRVSLPAFRSAVALLLVLTGVLFLALPAPAVRAQTTVAPVTSFNGGAGANDFVYHVAVQTDGRILIGGRFTTYDGTARSGVARLNADGSLDTSFNPGSGTVGNVYFVTEQANGQILLAGDFTAYDGTVRNGVARLNTDGSLDTTFDPAAGSAGKAVFSIGVQVDGRLIVGGRFTTFGGTARSGVARLNADGSLDTSFDPGTGVSGTSGVNEVLVQPDGRILLAGFFNSYDGTLQPGLVRVNTDGSLDTGFVTGLGVARGNFAQSIALQPDGQIIVGGNFIRFNGAAAGGIVRLNTDGSTDTTFNAGTGASGRTDVVYALAVQADGKIVVGGDFDVFDAVAGVGIVRLNADGSVDTTFDTNGGVGSSYVYNLALQPDGGILLAGNFVTVGGVTSPGVARLDTNGTNESEDVVTISTDTRRIGPDQASGTTAAVTLTRAGNLSGELTVLYRTGGAAVSGVDYQPLTGKIKIKAGHASRVLSVESKDSVGETGTSPLKLFLSPGTGYVVGDPAEVKIKIVH